MPRLVRGIISIRRKTLSSLHYWHYKLKQKWEVKDMHQYAIGLDIGITSVGWAALALDADENPCGILDFGSRIFTAAEQPKTGASLAAPRREARSARRRLRRHRHRNERIRNLIVSSGLLSKEELSQLFDGQLSDIYAVRVKALDTSVSRSELARIMLHLSQRRGFRSNRKGESDQEDGKLLAAVNKNKERMGKNGYRTAGEMFLKDPLFAEHKRNKGGNYIATVTRVMVEDEIRKIFSAQRNYGSEFASAELENAYLEILLSQRSFDEGPGGNSPYGGSQIERMVGLCTLEPDEPRAAKASYSFEYFSLLEKINHIRLIHGGESTPLTDGQRRTLIELAHKSDTLSYAKIRKELNIPANHTFNMIRYKTDVPPEEVEKKEKIVCMKAYHQMRRAVDRVAKGRFAMLSNEQRNEIARVLSLYKTGEKIERALTEAGIEPCDIAELETLSFSKFGHLSVKACDKLIPFLEKGMNYNDACTAAGYDFRAHSKDGRTLYLPPLGDDCYEVTSPVVRRAISQTIKIVNAIIRRYGHSPVYVNIELAREMAKDFAERSKLKKQMDDNQKQNERMMQQIREYKHGAPTGIDLVKFKLFSEQGGVCAYSQRQMSLERLFEDNYAEVDHIIPYSISFDDSYKNKALVLTEENRNKGNRLPMQYLTGKRKDSFVVWVNACVRDYRKRRLLLKEAYTAEDEANFKERNLQDTKTMARFMYNYINDNLQFNPSFTGRKKRVTAVNGAVTAYMRKRWGISKVREDGDRHHAVDAVIIGCTTDGMIQRVSRYASWHEKHYMRTENGSILIDPNTGEIKQEFPYPWPWFRKELEARLSNDPSRAVADLKLPFYMDDDAPHVRPLFVSRMPTRKVTGAAHKDTVKSPKALDEGYTIVKRPLTSLKLDSSGEISGYYKPESDRLLYGALKKQLAEHGGTGAKAFTEPFRKPKSDGTPGPIVNKVKLLETTTLTVPVHDGCGAADNDSMVRIDVFHIEGDGYYFVPIYVADTLRPELPSKAVVAAKSYEEWKDVKDEDFIFSLYPNDLVKVKHRRGIKLSKVFPESTLPPILECKEAMFYYISSSISTGAVRFITNDNTYTIHSLGLKTLESIEKYTVDVLGEYHPVRKEKRQRFDIKKG